MQIRYIDDDQYILVHDSGRYFVKRVDRLVDCPSGLSYMIFWTRKKEKAWSLFWEEVDEILDEVYGDPEPPNGRQLEHVLID